MKCKLLNGILPRIKKIFEPKMVSLSAAVDSLYNFEKKFKLFNEGTKEAPMGCPLDNGWLWVGCESSEIKREYFLSNRGLEDYLFGKKNGLKLAKLSREELPSVSSQDEYRVSISFNSNATCHGDNIYAVNRVTGGTYFSIESVCVKRNDINRIKFSILKEALLDKCGYFKSKGYIRLLKRLKDFILKKIRKTKTIDLGLTVLESAKKIRRLKKKERRAQKRRDARLRKDYAAKRRKLQEK